MNDLDIEYSHFGFPQSQPTLTMKILPSVVFGIVLYATATEARTAQPTLNIFSTQVIENIKETSNAARNLENDLQGVIEELEKHQQLYKESKCHGAVGDQGCNQISRQMAQTYTVMLDTMAERLPDMERNILMTRDALKTRLAKELGRNRTGHDLQLLLRSNKQGISAPHRTRVRRQGLRLSDRFRQYFYLVNQGNTESLALLGSEMYLDMDETSELIQLTQQQLHRAKLYVDLSEHMGTITPEMDQTVSEVKRIIFGEYDETSDFVPADLDTLDQNKARGDYCSEFDPNC